MAGRQWTSDPDEHLISRRDVLRRAVLSGAGLAALSTFPGLPDALAAAASGGKLSKLIAAAQKEGQLNMFGVDPTWVHYAGTMNQFQQKYGINVTDSSPTAVGAEILQSITSLKGQDREADAIELSPAFARDGTNQGLFAPYKVQTWQSVPAGMKDPHGNWVATYWGAIAFLTVNNAVKRPPKDWKDLLRPEYKGMVAINGDPRASGQAFGAVMGAALANGGSLDNIAPGIDFFARLQKLGNFIAAPASTANIEKGITPIALKWDFLSLTIRDDMKSQGGATVTVPKSGVYGSYYCQSVNRFAPHPMAGRLWVEFIMSDAGQLLYLAGYGHPSRYHDLLKRRKIPRSIASTLPPASAYKHVKFATLGQIARAAAVVQAQWGPKIAGG